MSALTVTAWKLPVSSINSTCVLNMLQIVEGNVYIRANPELHRSVRQRLA